MLWQVVDLATRVGPITPMFQLMPVMIILALTTAVLTTAVTTTAEMTQLLLEMTLLKVLTPIMVVLITSIL